MRKLLIADSSEVFVGTLKTMLSSRYELQICDDGSRVLADLEQFRPDVFVLNLMMPHVDGLSILQKTLYRPTVTVALTTYTSAYIEYRLRELGVDYIMVTPSARALRDRLLDVAQMLMPTPEVDESAVSNCLKSLSIPIHYDGYRHLCVAIPLYAKDPDQMITKEIYPYVSDACNCTDARTVERSIRNAIQFAWAHKEETIWKRYFSCNTDGSLPCPTNKEFISILATKLLHPA